MDAIYVRLLGRMGNNMFQLAAAASLAHRMGLRCLAWPDPTFWASEPDNCPLPEYIEKYKPNLFRNFRFVDSVPRPYTLCQEVSFDYCPLPRMNNLCLSGYFQSEKYFHKPLVRRLFRIEDGTKDYLEKRYKTLLRLHPVSINVRRGDYLQVSDCHPVQPLAYFEKAICHIGKDRHFLVTSDDPEWCKGHFTGGNFHVVDDIGPVENLYLQSMCHGHIISNSTYSWWGAWLDSKRNKQVVCPRNWFGPKLAHLNTDDLIPKGWHVM